MGQLAGPVMRLTLQNLDFGRNSVAVIGYRQYEVVGKLAQLPFFRTSQISFKDARSNGWRAETCDERGSGVWASFHLGVAKWIAGCETFQLDVVVFDLRIERCH